MAICEGTKLLIAFREPRVPVIPVSTLASAAHPGKIPAKSEAASGYSCPPLAPGTECGFAAPLVVRLPASLFSPWRRRAHGNHQGIALFLDIF
jgi:hypothetical protein